MTHVYFDPILIFMPKKYVKSDLSEQKVDPADPTSNFAKISHINRRAHHMQNRRNRPQKVVWWHALVYVALGRSSYSLESHLNSG